MARFSYKGVDKKGESISGVIESVDRKCAVAELTAKGCFASEITEFSEALKVSSASIIDSIKFGSSKVSSKDILAITTQMSTAISAGLPLLNALEIIEAQQHKPQMKELLGYLAKSVSSGDSLSDAMAKRENIFSKLYISMVRVGETGGILDQTMKQLASLLAREEKIKTSMTNAMIYPVVLLVAGIIAVVILLTAVMPKMINTLGVSPQLLPLPTKIVMGASGFFTHYYWAIVPAIAVMVISYVRWKNSSDGRLKLDTYKLKAPILGSVLTKIAVGRFARTLGALTTCGITILQALGVVRDTLGNEFLAGEIDEVSSKVSVGESLATPLSSSGHFPPLLVQLVSLGEQTGKLDELLLNAADTFDEDADSAINRFVTIFPILIIVLVALLIGFIIVAMIMPIMTMDFGGLK